jgi:hypothetical protein
MLRVFSEGDAVYRLEDGTGARIGTIRGRAVSFRGFATEGAARDAAVAAWHAMNDALRREYPSWPRYDPALDRLRTTHDGAYEWFYDGTKAIARLARPSPVAREHTFGIELVLPSYSSEGVAISAAHGMSRAVAPHRESAPRDTSERAWRVDGPADAAELVGAGRAS